MKILALVGLPGSGKSSVARELKEKFRWNWIDVDAEVERQNNKKISTIIREEGEQRFRDLELCVIREALKKPKSNDETWVLSLGGGALLNDKVKELLLEKCFTICLTAATETLLERVRKDELLAQQQGENLGVRPLLVGNGLAGIEERLRGLIEKRKGLYDLADLAIKTDGKTAEEVAALIVSKFSS